MTNFFKRAAKYSDLVAAGAVVLVVVMMIIPLPAFVLDLAITLNVSVALAIVVATLYMPRAIDFSSFPSLLLLTTLFRLAINVSVTRLILLHGDAGHVVEAFGSFVVGGNVVVGLVIFLILVVIQFVVVTAGAGRVAEVGARFTLDAMPGKQMAIDADLNAGQITEDQARVRREDIAREADFYGAMDGASKFVKGDAMAAVLITAINLVGGIVIGVVQQGRPLSEAVQHFSLLSVGDGLAAQIPALLISVATGIIVTRSSSKDDLGTDVVKQITSQRKAPLVAGVVICSFALVPGLPKIPFIIIGGLFFLAGRAITSVLAEREAAEAQEAATAALPGAPHAERPGARGTVDRPRRAVHRLRPRAAGRRRQRRLAAGPRRRGAPPGRRRPRRGHPAGAHPRRRRAGLARVRDEGARQRGRARLGHGRPPARAGPGRRRRPARRHPHHRARLRPAGGVDPRSRPRRGRGPGLHRGRRRVGHRHPPHRDDPQPRGRAAHATGRSRAARQAQGIQRRCR